MFHDTLLSFAERLITTMDKEVTQAFCNILKRIYAKENSEKYNLICVKPLNEDEERVWQLCESFWHPDYDHRTSDIEKYEPNPNLDNATAKRHITEITQLLDKLGWYK